MADNIVGSFLGASAGLQSSASSTSEILVETYKKTRQPELNTANAKKSDLEKRKNFFSTLRSKLTNLTTQIDNFTASDALAKFKTRSITSSDPSVVSVTVDSTAESGINSMKVNRLATNDILVSKRMQIGADQLFTPTGSDLTFKINGKDVKITIAENTTKENAIKAIANAINNVTDMTVTASYVKDTETTGRLTLTSKSTGGANRITFDDNSSGVLNALGFNNVDSSATNRTQTVTDTTLAYYKAPNYSNLDASAEINGLDITRSSNTVTDVLPGVTINLLKPQLSTDSSIIMTTAVNAGAVESLINPIISAYNDALKYIKANPTVLQSESSVSSLYSRLRAVSSDKSTSTDPGNPTLLTELGFKINSDGTLILNDRTVLTDLLKNDSTKVADLFTSSDGFAAKIKETIANMVGDGGLLTLKNKTLGDQIDLSQKKITTLENSIDKQATAMRKQYESMLSSYLSAQSQFNMLNAGYSSMGK